MDISYTGLKMQSYLKSENIDITNEERKFIFQLRTKMFFRIKSNFRGMFDNIMCEGCFIETSTTKHTLECKILIGQN